ncbi:MAG TPA: ABC-F family ATP-binding cassette domain-containing protein [Candidatus Galloscillospira stercoripullorum]|nr:ABC-F family ATP-binding cassette domain-containing protein [Candidatus Galloscillospira stercoripullorum]
MLQVKHLTITHRKDLTTLVEDLNFVLGPGDRAALIGEEGNGKSTVLKLLYDPALVAPYAEWQGEISPAGLVKGYLAQELTEEERALSAGRFARSCPAFRAAGAGELHRLCQRLGLDAQLFHACRPMSSLSGGERLKLRLALLMLEQPDVLLLDEPSNDLDLPGLQALERFLLSCPVPVLYVSHDEALLSRTANLIVHLERLHRRTTPRCTVARGGYQAYMEQRQAAFHRQEQLSRKEHAEFDAKMEKFRQIRSKVEHQQNTISRQDPSGGRLLKKKMHAVQSMGRRFEKEREDLTPMPVWEQAILTAFDPERSAVPSGKAVLRLDLQRLTAGDRVLSEGVRLWVTGPEKVGIIAPNGAGKSTLLRRVAEELLQRPDIRAAYMAQDYREQLLGDLTPVELLSPSGRKEDVTRARTLLGAMKYKTEEMEHPAEGLSGGQRAKLLFLSMVLQGSNVLILDEPTRNFSPLSAPVIRGVLSAFPGAIISVSHDRLYLAQVCDRLLALTPQGLIPTEL